MLLILSVYYSYPFWDDSIYCTRRSCRGLLLQEQSCQQQATGAKPLSSTSAGAGLAGPYRPRGPSAGAVTLGRAEQGRAGHTVT